MTTPGWIALHGGGEFQRGSEIGDRRLIVAAGGADARVMVVPTAAGIDFPEAAARNGVAWFRQLGAQADSAMVVDAASANDPAVIARLEEATLIYLPGGDPIFLVAALRGSQAWRALVEAHQRGVIVGGASAGAMALGVKMWNPRTGGLVDGLGLIPVVTVPHFRAGPIDRARDLRRRLDPALRLFGIAERTSAIFNGAAWTCWGPGEVMELAVDGEMTYQSGESFE